jgi:RNA polymerase sigma-70 factor (ECF subfamily)
VDEAEDLTQDIFVKVFQSLDRYRSRTGLVTWWARSRAITPIDNYRRRARRKSRRSRTRRASTCIRRTRRPPLRQPRAREQARLVHRGLPRAAADLREPLVLCDLKATPTRRPPATLEIPLGTVKSASTGDVWSWRSGGAP